MKCYAYQRDTLQSWRLDIPGLQSLFLFELELVTFPTWGQNIQSFFFSPNVIILVVHLPEAVLARQLFRLCNKKMQSCQTDVEHGGSWKAWGFESGKVFAFLHAYYLSCPPIKTHLWKWPPRVSCKASADSRGTAYKKMLFSSWFGAKELLIKVEKSSQSFKFVFKILFKFRFNSFRKIKMISVNAKTNTVIFF